ncbi:MAG: hypothetical protein ABEI57_07585 [Halapricum sp.]
MSLIELLFALAGLTIFVVPAFFLYDNDREGVKDPAAREIEQRRERDEGN